MENLEKFAKIGLAFHDRAQIDYIVIEKGIDDGKYKFFITLSFEPTVKLIVITKIFYDGRAFTQYDFQEDETTYKSTDLTIDNSVKGRFIQILFDDRWGWEDTAIELVRLT